MNKSKFHKILLLIAMALLITTGAFAEETPVKNLTSYKLKNGLQLFVAENHTVPLVYIEVAVKGGAVAQTRENAGLFHLYEHMMFKSNSLYKSEEEMQNALTRMGVPDWNGSTGNEYVNYYFTIPSDKLEDGLKFWQAALCTPEMNKREFETEKKVVLSEIEGDKADKSHVYRDFVSEKMFPEAPWTRSPGGTIEVIQNATVSQLKKIQSEYYIPNNAALFVGGDVNPEEVYNLVNKIWGKWKKGKDPWVNNKKQFNQAPLSQTEYYVMPFDKISSQIAEVIYLNRGPDAEFNTSDTYAADILLTLIRDPQSYYVRSLVGEPDFAIPGQEYVSFSYLTQRRHGILENDAIMLAPEQYLPQRVKLYAEELPETIRNTIPSDQQQAEEKMQNVKQYLENDRIYSMETARGILNDLRFWWVQTDEQYFYDYISNMEKQTPENLEKFVDNYITGKNALVIVLINPEVYENQKEIFETEGFGLIE